MASTFNQDGNGQGGGSAPGNQEQNWDDATNPAGDGTGGQDELGGDADDDSEDTDPAVGPNVHTDGESGESGQEDQSL